METLRNWGETPHFLAIRTCDTSLGRGDIPPRRSRNEDRHHWIGNRGFRGIVLDATNPLAKDLSGLTVGFDDSGAEQVSRWALGARVAKVLNMTGAGNMDDPNYSGQAASMFVCGDDDKAKSVASQLASDLGFDVVDAGPLISARLLEPMALLWIKLAFQLGNGPDVAFGLLRR